MFFSFSLCFNFFFFFCLSCHFKPFFVIFDTFSPITDYNCHCFKILNSHQLRFVEAKENDISKHFQEKDFDIENFYEIWRVGEKKLQLYKAVIVIDDNDD